ncbi:oligopeptide transport ATP-binding protein OppF [Halalkalibacter wakoensis JCM 9140]|uniref:Oligopeptide transport ATP-binding protein OppF n=1 Tax=Halalkalibacter wakoensis JCM 9140 TaxID=1236970 RepID=W4Q433_9BACI|nr:dipeptide ABC transporter ATP-binding protein [Halalkalibacter wakoensis]GAE26747.1 oligopeptide transport ATP-binding protein OppF [Halalkalibacter wakoensis JCM 9140]
MEPILEIKNLKKYFPVKQGFIRRASGQVKAVDDVSLTLYEGETLGLVGESGCGKSTFGRTVLQLVKPTSGEVMYKGKDLSKLSFKEMRPYRREIQMVFQDPYSSLNSRKTVRSILEEPMKIHHLFTRKEREEKVDHIMELVGLNRTFADRYPHEFSGGQRQRIGIARALMLDPSLIIADEPVSALDVSVQAQVLNLMQDLQKQLNLTYLFIAHDLSVVKHFSSRVGVMYLGRLVELASKTELYKEPLHPYTQALMSAVPIPKTGIKRERILLTGDVPNPQNPPTGCAFHERCHACMDICKVERPELKEVGKGRVVACHLYK